MGSDMRLANGLPGRTKPDYGANGEICRFGDAEVSVTVPCDVPSQ